MALVKKWSEDTLSHIVSALQLTEKDVAAQLKSLMSPMSPQPVGAVREWSSESGAFHLIYVGLTVPMIFLDSHMIFCFSSPESALPHFTLDAVKSGDHYAFHLDLIPRVDLAINKDYAFKIYQPLTQIHEAALKIEGLTPAHLSPLQYAMMSPWMLAQRANEKALDCIRGTANKYLEHWLTLAREPLDFGVVHGSLPLGERDKLHRQALFSKEIDPVWNQVERLLGIPTSDSIRELLMGNQRGVS